MYGHELSVPVFETRQEQEFLSHSDHPDRLWGPKSFLFKGYCSSFPRPKMARAQCWPL